MLNDKFLKRGWRNVIMVLYTALIASIVTTILPINERFTNALIILQVLASVSICVFAWFYYNKPGMVKSKVH